MFETIRAVAMDFDGVLTDGGLWMSANGEEMKRLCIADVTGIGLAREAGIKLALISGDSTPSGMGLVRRYAERMKIKDVYTGCHDKAGAIREFAKKEQLELREICFMGDDVIDLPPMALVGLSAAPANAQKSVKAKASFIAFQNGGFGAVRELLDAILAAQKHA